MVNNRHSSMFYISSLLPTLPASLLSSHIDIFLLCEISNSFSYQRHYFLFPLPEIVPLILLRPPSTFYIAAPISLPQRPSPSTLPDMTWLTPPPPFGPSLFYQLQIRLHGMSVADIIVLLINLLLYFLLSPHVNVDFCKGLYQPGK